MIRTSFRFTTLARALPLVASAFNVAIAPFAWAQAGDRGSELQTPLAAHIKVPPAPALSPEEALKTLRVAPGFRIELVAAEPLVRDPVVVQFGPDGRMWVVEMTGYMPNVDGVGEDQPVGAIAILEDTDGDGRMDKRTVFADKLVMPRALSIIGDGALVAAPTKLWYYRDTDRDGVSDERHEIAGDYGNTSGPEHNANGLLWAMDNWIYSANHTVRYRYEGGRQFRADRTLTRGQWGISQDDTGRLYYNSNSDPIRMDVIPGHYAARSPAMRIGGTNAFLAPTNLPVWPIRVTAGINRGYNTLNDEGKMTAVTAAGAPLVYRGGLFPSEFSGNVFICEPSGHLIKRLVIEERGGSLSARNAYEGAEFLASTDERFRPVNLALGPDGALYVADMYRGVLQHRVYVTTFLRNQILERGLETPINLGRIYRVVPEGINRPAMTLLTGADPAQLVSFLGHGNGWVRDTAQRLLVEKRDAAVAGALRTFATKSERPLGRLHALWTLEGLGQLDRPTLQHALGDPDPRLVAAGIRLSEPFLKQGDPALTDRVLSLGTVTEPAVRLQLALSLGEVPSEKATSALLRLAQSAATHPLLNDAIANSFTGREESLFSGLAKGSASEGAALAPLVALVVSGTLTVNVPARTNAVLAAGLGGDVPSWIRSATLDGIQAFVAPPTTGRGGFTGGRGASPGGPALGGAGTSGAGTGGPAGAAGARGGRGFGGRGGRGGGSPRGQLAAEPTALVAVAASTDALASRATTLLETLRWPGKPGTAANVAPLTPEEQERFDVGRERYAALCAACHLPTGQGQPGIAASLIGSRWATGDARVLARLVLAGKARENLIMPPMREILDDAAIASVLTYVRRSWGNAETAVTPAAVAQARVATQRQTTPFTDAELELLAEELGTAATPARRPPAP